MDVFKADPEVIKLKELGIEVEYLLEAITKFENATDDWHARLSMDLGDIEQQPLMAKYINDQMMNLDKTFLLQTGLPERPIYRHVAMSSLDF